MMRTSLSATVFSLLLGSCAIIPPNWWDDVPRPTPDALYFVGSSPDAPPENVASARDEAHIDTADQAAKYSGSNVKSSSALSSRDSGTEYHGEIEQDGNGPGGGQLEAKNHYDSREGVYYVLMQVKNPDPISWPAYYKGQIESWWDNVERLHGRLRINAFVGGWNFWHKNDPGYIYSDLVGSLFGGNDPGKIYDYPAVGVGVRFPIWKVFILNGAGSTSRISLGAGLGVPLGFDLVNITPWAACNLSWTNGGIEFAPSFEGGVDFAYKRFLLGFDCSVIPTRNWVSLTYGITAGVKVW